MGLHATTASVRGSAAAAAPESGVPAEATAIRSCERSATPACRYCRSVNLLGGQRARDVHCRGGPGDACKIRGRSTSRNSASADAAQFRRRKSRVHACVTGPRARRSACCQRVFGNSGVAIRRDSLLGRGRGRRRMSSQPANTGIIRSKRITSDAASTTNTLRALWGLLAPSGPARGATGTVILVLLAGAALFARRAVFAVANSSVKAPARDTTVQ